MPDRKIFISYSHEDRVQVDAISSANGDPNEMVWLDRFNLSPGDDWRKNIERAIKSSRCLVLFASPKSVKSKEVLLEVDYALYKRKRVIPVMIKECKLPYQINNRHMINLVDGDPRQLGILKDVITGISKKKRDYTPKTENGAKIIKDVQNSNSFYYTAILPYKYVWASSVAAIVLLFTLQQVSLVSNNSSTSTNTDDLYTVDTSIAMVTPPDTVSNVPFPADTIKHTDLATEEKPVKKPIKPYIGGGGELNPVPTTAIPPQKEEVTKNHEEPAMLAYFGANNFQLAAIDKKKNGEEVETSKAKRADKFRISFDFEAAGIGVDTVESYVVVRNPEGLVIKEDGLNSGLFLSKHDGLKEYTNRFLVDYKDGVVKQLSFDLKQADKYKPGLYNIQVYVNGAKVGEGDVKIRKGGLFW